TVTTSSSADTYSQTGSTIATQSSSSASSMVLFEQGSYSLGSYNLSSFAYSTGGSQNQASRQIDTAADSGTDSSTSIATSTQNGLSSMTVPIVNAYGIYGGQTTYTSASSSSDTYSDS